MSDLDPADPPVGATRGAAIDYARRGLSVVPIPFRSKNPGFDEWQLLRLTEKDIPVHFNDTPQNVGVLTGEPSGWLIDVDLDHPRCVELADQYLPPTPAIFGRPSNPRSHRLYRVSRPTSTRKHKSKSSGMLVELRSTGSQTVFPPSVHECGESIAWETPDAEPADIDPDVLHAAVKALANAVKVELGEKAASTAAQRKCQEPEARDDEGVDADPDGPVIRCVVSMLRMNMFDSNDGSGRLYAAACRCVEHNLNDAQAITAIRQYAQQRPFPREWTDEEILQRIRDAETKCTRGAAFADDQDANDQKQSHSATLVRLALQAELFHHDEEAYASFLIDGHRETHPINTKRFRTWLTHLFYLNFGRVPGSQALQDALGTLFGRALFASPSIPVAIRMAQHDGAYWLDLANPEWQAVRIDVHGWSVLDSTAVPVRFIRRKAMRALPTPVTGGSVAELRPFVNVREEADWVLLLGWLVATLRPTGPYPNVNICGEQGTAKTTLCRILRALIDPNKAPVRSAPRDPRDLMIAAANAWVIVLDNLSALPSWLSDALCRLATGGGFSTRELFSNGEEAIFDAMRPVMLNGIDSAVTRPDLLDRSVTLTLEPIPEEQRQTEAQLWSAFEAARPSILGALLSAVSVAMKRVNDVRLARIPRMADFAVWATAAEPGLDLRDGAFLKAYLDDRTDAFESIVENTPLAQEIVAFVDRVGVWTGPAAALLTELNKQVADAQRDYAEWPKSAKKLGGDLRRLAPCLRSVGIAVEIPKRRVGHKKMRNIKLERVSEERAARVAHAANRRAGPENGVSVRPIADHCEAEDAPQRAASNQLPVAVTPIAAHTANAAHCSPGCSNEEEVVL